MSTPSTCESAMRRGDFDAAWQTATSTRRTRVLVRCYHGLGDTIQFARFLPVLARLCRPRRCVGCASLGPPELMSTLGDLPSIRTYSVDTMTAHLAGALAVPTWTLLMAEADGRWTSGRGDSPWYPTMRLFRQPRPGDWESVIARVPRSTGGIMRAAQLVGPRMGAL